MLEANSILRMTTPESLYSRPDIDTIKREFHDLAMVWHPDHNASSHASDVFDIIKRLRDLAIEKTLRNCWEVPGLLKLSARDGRQFEARYQKKDTFELGTVYHGRNSVLFNIHSDHKDLYIRGENAIRKYIKYPDPKMKKDFEIYMPSIIESTMLADDSLLMVMKKTPDVFRLKDVLEHYGKVHQKNVAWIVSRMMSLASYFELYNICHYDLSIESIWISPKYHSAMIYGGWWYSYLSGQKLVAVPKRTMDNASRSCFKDKKASGNINVSLAKATARQLLGDISGASIMWNKDLPKPFTTWLMQPSSAPKALDEYKHWMEVIKESWGERKFHVMELDENDLFK